MLGVYFYSAYTLENDVHLYTADGPVRFAAPHYVIHLLLSQFSVGVFPCFVVALFVACFITKEMSIKK